MDVQNGERSDPGGTILPKNIQHCSGLIGKGGADVSLQAAGGTAWVRMGGGREQHSVI